MNTKFLLGLLATNLASAASLAGYISDGCHGERLWSYDVPSYDNCQDLSGYVAARSMVLADFSAGQVAFVYSSSDCSGDAMYSTDFDVCYTLPNDNPGSFSVAQAISRAPTVERAFEA